MNVLPRRIEILGAPRTYARGDYLFQAEDQAAGFFHIRSGEIRIFKLDPQGRELEVARLGAGDFLGEAVALVSGRFPFFAQAVRESSVRYFDRQAAVKAMAGDPSAAIFFVELLSRKCVTLSERVESLGLKTIRQRLIQYLLANCGGAGRCDIELRVKKTDLARHLGTISETLSRNLKQMQEDGLIEVRGKTIRVLACTRLRQELDD